MSDPIEEARRITEDILILHISGNCQVQVKEIEKTIAAALAARDEEIAELKAALDSVSFPDRRWK